MDSQKRKCTLTYIHQKSRLHYMPWGIMVIISVYFCAYLLTNLHKNGAAIDLNQRHKRDTDKYDFSKNITLNLTTHPNKSESEESQDQGIYPPDVFDLEKRRQGAVAIHVFGMLYMFAALAIVCDEFFVPALEVITFRLAISDDVAGATFMAAGGSAPELFTSIIGVFLAKSNVGVGTIVGSAVFNILFVIGMCGLLSRDILQLTWWPLFRDCSFYIISLVFLIYSFSDAKVEFYESIVLILIYFSYVTFMKFNQTIEGWVKRKMRKISMSRANSKNKISPSVRAIVESISNPAAFQANQHPKNTFSFGIIQLIMHSLDPAPEEEEPDHKEKLYAIARGKYVSVIEPTQQNGVVEQGYGEFSNITPTKVVLEEEGVKVIPDEDEAKLPVETLNGQSLALNENVNNSSNSLNRKPQDENGKTKEEQASTFIETCPQSDQKLAIEEDDVQMGEALDMSWPRTRAKQCVYLFLFPIMFLLSITLPDVRIPSKEKWFMASFFGSIIWIAVFSYIMVWMAHQIGQTIGLSETIMGLTFLAAGTSVPDLITSVIVARKGLGDMAVSSSVGSNIFDVTIGLPFPWLLKSIIGLGEAVIVDSAGLFCLVLLLFGMLLFVVISIAVCRWKMSKQLGFTMLLLYVLFLVLALLLELSVIGCPSLT